MQYTPREGLVSIKGTSYYAFECEGKVYRSVRSVRDLDRIEVSTATVREAEEGVAATLQVQALPGHLVYHSQIDQFSVHFNRTVQRGVR